MSSHDDGDFFRLYYLQDQSFLHLIQDKMITSILLFAGIIVLTILLAFALFYRRVFRPLEVLLVDAFDQIKKSNLSYRIPETEKTGYLPICTGTLITWRNVLILWFPGN